MTQNQIAAISGYVFFVYAGRRTRDGYVNETFAVEGCELVRENYFGPRKYAFANLATIDQFAPFEGENPQKWLKDLAEEILLYFLDYSDILKEWFEKDSRIRVDVIDNGNLIRTISLHYSKFA